MTSTLLLRRAYSVRIMPWQTQRAHKHGSFCTRICRCDPAKMASAN